MFFVSDPEPACRWWCEHVAPPAEPRRDGPFWWFDSEELEVGFHPADPVGNPVGRSPVVYWSVATLDAGLRKLLAAGCSLHRGPLAIGAGRTICQLVDPFGNCFGLDGPSAAGEGPGTDG